MRSTITFLQTIKACQKNYVYKADENIFLRAESIGQRSSSVWRCILLEKAFWEGILKEVAGFSGPLPHQEKAVSEGPEVWFPGADRSSDYLPEEAWPCMDNGVKSLDET